MPFLLISLSRLMLIGLMLVTLWFERGHASEITPFLQDELLALDRFGIKIPADQDVLRQYPNPTREVLDSHFTLLVWNTHKGKDAGWTDDYVKFAADKDIVLLQEYEASALMDAAIHQTHQSYQLATSFIKRNGDATGVLSGSIARPLSSYWLRSFDHEPILDTPKMCLVTEYQILDKPETLLVANIHAINFNLHFHRALERQIQQIANLLSKHTGPIIFGGDFNTWSKGRLAIVKKVLAPLGLKEIEWDSGVKAPALDHVFIRGVQVKDAHTIPGVKSSDHLPLGLDLLYN